MEPILKNLASIAVGVCMGQSLLKMFSAPPKQWRQVLLYLLLGATFGLPSWLGDENPILLFPFFMLGFLLLLPGEKLPKLVIGGIFYALLISFNMLVDSMYFGNTIQMVMLGCKTLAWCALSWFLFRMIPPGGLRLSKKLWVLVGGLTLAPLVSTLSFSIWGNEFQTEEQYQFYSAILQSFGYTILPFVLISALTLLAAAVVLSRHEALEQENTLAALREAYYTGLKQEQTGLRTLQHDLRNHVAAMQGLLEQSKQAQVAEYLAQLADSPAFCSGKRYAANEAANVVLCSKAGQMEAAGLVPDFQVELPATLSIPAAELCALLGNALDNAIEGAAKSQNRTVTLRARLEKGMFLLQVQNAVSGAVNSNLSTTKQDTSRHGFGIAGMRQIAQGYGGSLEATAKDGCFTLLVCFPCKE